MAYTVLARRFRSSTFDQVIGQGHIAQTLKKAIATGRIAHAYLFCGTRGTGKTSMARIMAKALNCLNSKQPTTEPCLECDSCKAIARGDDIDVLEIDAASNTQVDKTREVILDHAQYSPVRARFRIFIIDEVHMLSKASFNALLKTLEEPPAHVKFILATTEPEKVLPTILSRCQRYDFRNIPTAQIADHLKNICQQEKIEADEDALNLVAAAGAGSMRDALSLLDRLLSIGEERLTVPTIEQLLGLPRGQAVFDLITAIGEGRCGEVVQLANRLIDEGLSADSLIYSLVGHLRNLLIIRTCGKDSGLVEPGTIGLDDLSTQASRFEPATLSQDIVILEELKRQIRQTQAGRAIFDATLVRLAMADQFASIADLLAGLNGSSTPAGAGEKKKPEPTLTTPSPVIRPQPPAVSASSPAKVPSAPVQQAAAAPDLSNVQTVGDEDLKKIWPALMAWAARDAGQTIFAGLAMAHLSEIRDNKAIISFPHSAQVFARTWSGDLRKKELLRDVLSKIIGRPIGVEFEISEENSNPTVTAAPTPPPGNGRPTPQQVDELSANPTVRAIMDKMGGTVVRIMDQ